MGQVNRARVGVLARSRAINSPVPGFDHKQVREVLEDLITAISVIEALTFLARKAEIIDFSLKKLLDDYLGDIQIMTEFAPQREQIVAEFREIMDAVHRIHPQAEIHIVAHSEERSCRGWGYCKR